MCTRETSAPLPVAVALPPAGAETAGVETAARAPAEGRLASLDLIRGVAILGILLANIPDYSTPGDLIGTHAGGGSPLDVAVAALTLFLIQGKFITLLSILFGAGLALQADRAHRGQRSFTRYYAWRMVLLFLIGLGHALLLWNGDILTSYAFLGLAALLAQQLLSQRGLLGLLGGCFLWAYGWLFLCTLLVGLSCVVTSEADVKLQAGLLAPPAEHLDPGLDKPLSLLDDSGPPWPEKLPRYFSSDNQVLIFRQGTLADMIVFRALALVPYIVEFWTVLGWYLLGCFLLGVYLLRRGVFHDPVRHRPFLRTLILVGLGVGVPCHVAAVVAYLREPDGVFCWFWAGWGALGQALGYLGLLLLWAHSGWAEPLQRWLRAVGRLALSNYLLQSLLCGLIFYSYGLRLFGRLDRTAALGVVLLIWALQLLASPWWLRWFHAGPVEWLWRSLAEWRPRPFLRRP